MRDITKAFNGTFANKNINLHVSSGEVLGLLGENGAGKTTLMNILYGLYRPDSGSVLINGEDVRIRNPHESMNLGIGMIHQHFMLVDNHSVLENIALGFPDSPFFFPDRFIRKKINTFSEKYGLYIDPDKQIWELSAGEQQRVEILKALFLESDLLIMDEPTSVLTPQESIDLFSIIRRMKDEGHSVILISHKLDEIMANCSRVTVLRKGETVGDSAISDVDERSLSRMMVGRDIILTFEKKPLPRGKEVLNVENLHVISDRGLETVNNVSFTVHENEIFGIAGVSGNGQRELIETITGLRKARSGNVSLFGSSILNKSPRVINNRGVTHVPEERIRFGIVPNLLIYENAVLKHHHSHPFSSIMFLDYEAVKGHAKDIIEKFSVSAPSINVPMKSLSGGNIQKLIVGREINNKPPLLVASHPTYGLDVGATEYIRKQLLQRREEGGAVLIVSEDLEELVGLCDRVGVMFKGRFTGIVDPSTTRLEDIGLLMTGIEAGEDS
ncbi:MAG: ABC transporter ATP-binding protein [Spirochaetes bacterium]|nr:ABC transporter ATP-binding protein [Spirochaetota bacterium]